MKIAASAALLMSAAMLIPAAVQAQMPMNMPMTPAGYVATAGASDLFERRSAQIVLETTADPKVKDFATMMLAQHAQSTQMVLAAAKQSGVVAPPAKLTPAQAEMILELGAEHGPQRDSLYIAQQRAAHNGALNVQQAYALDGTAPPLQAAAAKIVPVVQSHIAMLMTM